MKLALLALVLPLLAQAAEPELKTLLARPILPPGTALEEVQAFCEGRVPLMPSVQTRAEWEAIAERMRREALEEVYFRGETARQWRLAKTKVEWLETIEGGPGYAIKKMRYEVLPELWMVGLLYEPTEVTGKIPVHLAVNGHDPLGKAAPYKQMRCINLAKRGVATLNVEWLGMGQLRGASFAHGRLNQLDLCGVSGLAPFYLAMSRGLDVLLALPYADAERVAVSGLSGGGWQTITISALDTRVKLCNPVAGYSSFRTRARFPTDLGDSEQTPNDLATVADYTHFTAMLAGRAALLTFNAKDNCCFASGHALEPLESAARPIFALFGDDRRRLRTHVNFVPGTHNFEVDNRQAFYAMVGDTFFPGVAGWEREIPSEAEVKTPAQLEVPLPAENADLHLLAEQASGGLPRSGGTREKLSQVVAFAPYSARGELAGTAEGGGVTVKYWKLRVGEAWTVPVVELARPAANGTTMLLTDGGRMKAETEVAALLAKGERVLMVDPFYFGESAIPQRAYLYALLVSATGARPLGLQASQVAAVARWAGSRQGAGPLRVEASGPRTGLIALVAAALEEEAITSVSLRGEQIPSLKQAISNDWSYETRPEVFCFGLLEHFDIPQLRALARVE